MAQFFSFPLSFMTMTLLKRPGQLFCTIITLKWGLSLSSGLSQIMHLAKVPQTRNHGLFSASHQGADDIYLSLLTNFYHVIRVVSIKFFYCTVIICPLVISKHFVERNLELIKISCFSLYFHSLMLANTGHFHLQ